MTKEKQEQADNQKARLLWTESMPTENNFNNKKRLLEHLFQNTLTVFYHSLKNPHNTKNIHNK